jgi:hypothetical protein
MQTAMFASRQAGMGCGQSGPSAVTSVALSGVVAGRFCVAACNSFRRKLSYDERFQLSVTVLLWSGWQAEVLTTVLPAVVEQVQA